MATVNISSRDTSDLSQLGVVTNPYAQDRRGVSVSVSVEKKTNGEIAKATASYRCRGCGCNHTEEIPVKKP